MSSDVSHQDIYKRLLFPRIVVAALIDRSIDTPQQICRSIRIELVFNYENILKGQAKIFSMSWSNYVAELTSLFLYYSHILSFQLSLILTLLKLSPHSGDGLGSRREVLVSSESSG